MTQTTKERDPMRGLLNLIQNEILDVLDRLQVDHLSELPPHVCRRVFAHALVELSGRHMQVLIRDDADERPGCLELVGHLGLYVVPPTEQPQ